MTMRLSMSSLAGTARTEVAVGTERLAAMFWAGRAAAPRSRLRSAAEGGGTGGRRCRGGRRGRGGGRGGRGARACRGRCRVQLFRRGTVRQGRVRSRPVPPGGPVVGEEAPPRPVGPARGSEGTL